jgi:hypothetical protein
MDDEQLRKMLTHLNCAQDDATHLNEKGPGFECLIREAIVRRNDIRDDIVREVEALRARFIAADAWAIAWKRAAKKWRAWAECSDGNLERSDAALALWQKRCAAAEARVERLETALRGLYEHTKNNYQICGLNEAARAALADNEGE